MSARKKLDELKVLWGVRTDEELAIKLDTQKTNIDSWVKRDKIPDKWRLIMGQMSNEKSNFPQQSHNNPDTYAVSKISAKASAGGGNHLESLDVYDSGETMYIDRGLFERPPRGRLGIMQVDGYSMTPMLWHDNWVIFEEIERFTKDGLYILNFDNTLMVKLLQADLISGKIDIISSNKDYKSYTYDPKSDQTAFYIIGKVVRVIM